MDKQQSLQIRMELLWWVFTAIVIFGVLYPILKNVDHYPFLIPNIIFIIVFITFARYIFLLKHTFLAQRQTLKVIIFFLCLPLFFYLSGEINSVRAYLDENGIDALVKNLPYEEHWGFANYIKTQMNFFGSAGLVVTVLLPFRLLISIWRNRNRGTV
jgi:hypothetical protein